MILYSKTTNGFYDTDINKVVPSDVVEVSKEWREQCLNEQALGKEIKPDKDGLPKTEVHVNTTEENKLEAIQKVEDKFKSELLGLIESTALQPSHSYYCDEDSRNWLSFCIASGLSARLLCINKGGVTQRVLHTNEQLKQVAIDILAKIEAEYDIMDSAKQSIEK